MKLILIIALVLIVFTFFRRLSREQTVGTEPMAPWEQRPPLQFEDFYTQYYSRSGLDRSTVQAALKQVAQLLHAPAELLRPEDRLNDIKPGALDSTLGMMRKLSQSSIVPDSIREKLAQVDWNVSTVDDYIRKLGILIEHIHGGKN